MMKHSFFGFFGGLPFSPFSAESKPWGWTKTFGGKVVEMTPHGQVRIDKGLPNMLLEQDFFGSPSDYVGNKIYQASWRLKNIKNLDQNTKNVLIGDIRFLIESMKKMYPFDSMDINKLLRSLARVEKSKSGQEAKVLFDQLLDEMSFIKGKRGISYF